MIEELQDIFPRLTTRNIWKLLLTIKFRYMKFGTIGISRLEASRFGISERQLQWFIDYLRDLWAIKKVRFALATNWFKCNVYSLAWWFSDGLKEVKEYIKKQFVYIDPVAYVKARFPYKIKYGKLKFEVNWDKYIIHLRGRFKDKIYDVWNNCIINPLKLSS